MSIFHAHSKAAVSGKLVMSAMDAIYKRRAVRSYKPYQISREDIEILLSAAVQAPTALHEEPWSFAVIQDPGLLEKISDSVKAFLDPGMRNRLSDLFKDHGGNVFYNAGTLMGDFVAADCWLAAENLMLAACAMNLGTCVIGLAVQALNTSEWKDALDVPPEMTAYVPIVMGVSERYPAPVSRKKPEIICWKSIS